MAEIEKKHRIVVCAAVLRSRTQTIPDTSVEETIHEVVMQLRAPHKTYGANTWFLPGGKVEWGESIAKATARELKEELGITVRPEDVVNLGMKEVIREGAHDIMVYVLVEKFEGEPTNLDVKNTTRIDWFDVFIWKRLAEEYPFHEPMDVLTRITDYVNFKEYQKSSSEECFLCW